MGAGLPASRGKWRSGGKAPSRRKHGSLREESPALKNFVVVFFGKNDLIPILIKINVFKTWDRK